MRLYAVGSIKLMPIASHFIALESGPGVYFTVNTGGRRAGTRDSGSGFVVIYTAEVPKPTRKRPRIYELISSLEELGDRPILLIRDQEVVQAVKRNPELLALTRRVEDLERACQKRTRAKVRKRKRDLGSQIVILN